MVTQTKIPVIADGRPGAATALQESRRGDPAVAGERSGTQKSVGRSSHEAEQHGQPGDSDIQHRYAALERLIRILLA